ncbi:Olfactory receptor, insect [Cinara cedri]|uniref:Olfactory receptor, insect n=1 Tax=Cinara cedri TaxID=506608 RepID=A0A5E4NFD3_9HEMI|nr:Olfactory receptor, insect [Cinara cedri]
MNDLNNAVLSKKQVDIFDELQEIITDHQNVIKHVNDCYSLFRSLMLSQIFVASNSHVLVWFFVSLIISGAETGDSMMILKVFSILPLLTFQLLMSCYLCETINEKKDAIIFSLYSSNWIDMNIKSKQLILLTMKINNVNTLKIMFTNTKIVNLEMFTKVCIQIEYDIFLYRNIYHSLVEASICFLSENRS